jgi:hypothetical protein
MHASIAWLGITLVLGSAGTAATTLPETAGYGPNPTLPAPQKKTLPTMKIAPAQPWRGN